MIRKELLESLNDNDKCQTIIDSINLECKRRAQGADVFYGSSSKKRTENL